MVKMVKMVRLVQQVKTLEASVVNNGNGTHTVTIVDGNGQTTSTVVKDGKNAEASVTNNGNGTHTLTVVDGNGNTTTTIVKDGATGAKGDTGQQVRKAIPVRKVLTVKTLKQVLLTTVMVHTQLLS